MGLDRRSLTASTAARLRRLLFALVTGCVTVTALLLVPPAAAAAPRPTPSADDRKAARQAFIDGQSSFKKGDYRHAAESFETAYKRAPHPDALWNAARSWFRAGEKTRAANLYAQYLQDAPPLARDRNSATDALRKLSPELGRLEIHATDVTDIRVDNEPLVGTSVYVNPGTHVIQGRHDDRVVSRSQDVAAGATVSVALVAPPPERLNPTPPPSPPPLAPPPPPPSRGLSPLVLLVGGGLTAGAGAVLIWSGVDTVNQKKLFDAAPTQGKLDAGRSKQTRTNVMIGVTAGLATLTAATAIFLVDWHSGDNKKVEVGLGPGTLTVRRTF
jgi:hypothetical protein